MSKTPAWNPSERSSGSAAIPPVGELVKDSRSLSRPSITSGRSNGPRMKLPHLWTDTCADLLRAFNNKGVQYLLIGSMAKALHCPGLDLVNDMDLMINSTPENARKVLSVFRQLGQDMDANSANGLVERGKRMRLFHGSTDVLTPPKQGFSFREAADRSTEALIPPLDIPVQVASMCDLKTLDSLGNRGGKCSNAEELP